MSSNSFSWPHCRSILMNGLNSEWRKPFDTSRIILPATLLLALKLYLCCTQRPLILPYQPTATQPWHQWTLPGGVLHNPPTGPRLLAPVLDRAWRLQKQINFCQHEVSHNLACISCDIQNAYGVSWGKCTGYQETGVSFNSRSLRVQVFPTASL
jgi:hypothetical protein